MKTKQSKLESAIEASINTGSGFIIAFLLTLLFNYVDTGILYVGDGLTFNETIIWTVIMTTVSILRSYFWRRFFVKELHQVIHKWVKEVTKIGE